MANHQRSQDLVLLLLRLAFGASMIIGHGWPKFLRLTGGEEIRFMDFMGLGPEISLGLAVFAELICAALLILGLFTRLAAAPLVFTMLVAIFKAHWGDPFSDIEGALLYLVPFICLMIAGGGQYALDSRMQKLF